MDKQLKVLITRPQPGADAFAAMLEGLEVTIAPVIEIRPVSADLSGADVMVITSAHAIPSGPPGMTCYCVGEATTARAAAAGLEAILGGQTAEDVARRIIADRPDGRIVYARGRHVAFDMVGAIRDAGLSAADVVVYDQMARPLTEQATELLRGGSEVIVPLFSARSAELFFENCPPEARVQIVAISDAVARRVPRRHQGRMIVVPNPDAAHMARAVFDAAMGRKRLEQG